MSVEEVRRDDEALIESARRGDQQAFSELVRRHQDEVFTLALRLTADREMAADITQDAFVRAWRAIPKFRGDARFSTWMHRITVNTAWTNRRRAARHRADRIEDLVADPAAGGITPEDAAASAHFRPRLIASLDTLPRGTRVVVVLKDVHGWSHGEIAEQLGITVTAAKVRLHRGRRRLRHLLFDSRPDGGDA